MAEDITDENVRRMTQRLINRLREEHPEQECEPDGLQIRDEIDLSHDNGRRRHRVRSKVRLLPSTLPTLYVGKYDWAAKRNAVINKLALEHDVDAVEILGRDRTAHIMAARKRAYKALRDLNYTYSDIGRMMNRDHSTVRAGIETCPV